MRIVSSFAVPSLAVFAVLAGCGAPDPTTAGSAPAVEDGVVTTESQPEGNGPDGHAQGVHWTRDEFAARSAKEAAAPAQKRRLAAHDVSRRQDHAPRDHLRHLQGARVGSYAGDEITGIDSWYSGFATATTRRRRTSTRAATDRWAQQHVPGAPRRHRRGDQQGEHVRRPQPRCATRRRITSRSTRREMAITRSTPISRAATPATARGTARARATGSPSSLPSSGSWTATPGAIRRTRRAALQGLAAVASVSAHELSEARTDPGHRRAAGTTPRARRTATSARGPSARRWSRSPTERSGSCRASGRMRPTTPAPAIRIPVPRTAASAGFERGALRAAHRGPVIAER